MQEALICEAINGHGDYDLSPQVSCLRVPLAAWNKKKETEKSALFKFFFISFGNKKTISTTVTSTDGNPVIPRTTQVARKTSAI